MTDLPQVSLVPPQRPCDGHPAAVTRPAGDARDGRGDARGDARGDGAGDVVLTLAPLPQRDQQAAPGPQEGSAAGVGEVPAAALDGANLAIGERAWLTVAHWAGQSWRGASKTVTNPRGPWHAQPESLAMHDAYRRSRAWVPPGHEGKFIGPAGSAYHLTGARFGLITGYAWAWLWARPLRITIAAVVAGAIALGFWLG
jgi:hypothetical protein